MKILQPQTRSINWSAVRSTDRYVYAVASPYRTVLNWAVVGHAFNPSTREAEAGGSALEASLVCRVGSRTARAPQRKPVLKKQKVYV